MTSVLDEVQVHGLTLRPGTQNEEGISLGVRENTEYHDRMGAS